MNGEREGTDGEELVGMGAGNKGWWRWGGGPWNVMKLTHPVFSPFSSGASKNHFSYLEIHWKKSDLSQSTIMECGKKIHFQKLQDPRTSTKFVVLSQTFDLPHELDS
jgi:hypothetical protein